MDATPTLAAPPHGLAPGLCAILRGLAALVARRFLHDPLRAVLIIPLWHLFNRAARRLDRLLGRLAAGPLPPPKPRTRRHSRPRRKPVYPTTRAWLIRALGPEAAAYASQLQALLAEPAAADLLASTAARRALAPIRRMLGITPPPSAASPAPLPLHRSTAPTPTRPGKVFAVPASSSGSGGCSAATICAAGADSRHGAGLSGVGWAVPGAREDPVIMPLSSLVIT